ncbi:inverse autotransporter beta domain-containing protein [Xenorhabdus doucetiae]|uniref:Adhesin/invasin n=1 Tax=Xenorhabdus doucetiae TaxID=351671 RepID=A0A068QQY7_9GAMM|nr:inverse autotransporter beta-barrel domain-containing protein [Xenorhabdus doucetiae]TYP00630.1 adhesin/invasin [Xenorhabdus doucetiae]CDG17462.1 putative invasin [Xenorhabdus doucetiae]
MLSHIGKGIFVFFFLYTLLIPYTITHSFADGDLASAKIYMPETDKKDNVDIRVNESSKKYLNSNAHKENSSGKDNQASYPNTPSVIAKNIQMAGNILSSSPSELAEQAKSYAVGKFNSTISSETQKWLSQFGTAKINFGLDRKGTLKNNSLALLLPLYDNKVDWLFFSQLGYRNKDSRNTINVGLGGRYFYQDWMYGLNTFYDYDLTGKNQRLGLGGEIWGDYIKFSANSYYRLSNWQNSRNFKDFHERPANGYDINGEFFLPAYPNLGAKLAYEQYFGDNVTLFNRDTKQKNPNLAKLGLTYTPVPLFTLGVDYKQGGSGHSETQFLANLSYKLGVPLNVQLSPENVASMRTLAGSRYDLVERNNNIVLDHQKIPIVQLFLPETITGYSQEQHDITVKLSSNTAVKQIHWATNEDFAKHGGKLSSRVGNTITVTLPKYLSGDNQNNNYPIYALAELENNQKSVPVEMRVIVRPFMLQKREEPNFTPAGPLSATGDKKDGYTFNPVITFDTAHRTPIKNTTINHVQWLTDPKTGADSGLQFIDWEQSDAVEIDENGHFKRKPTLISTQPHKGVKVYLQLDGQPPQFVGEVSFDEKPASFHVGKVTVSPAVPSLIADGSQTYTYSAVILDDNNNPAKSQKIADVNWSKDKDQAGLIWHPSNGDVTTDEEGKLTATATLASTVAIKDVLVSLAIGNQKPVPAEHPVSFTADIVVTQDYHIKGDIQVDPSGTLTADGQQKYTYTAVIVGVDGKPVQNTKITNAVWNIDSPQGAGELNLDQSDMEIKGDGKLSATLTSNKAFNGVVVSLTIGNHKPVQAKAVDFKPEQISAIDVKPASPLLVNKISTLTVRVNDATGKNPEANKTVNWTITSDKNGVTLNPTSSTTNAQGYATTTLTSTQAKTVTIEAAVEGIATKKSVDVEFKWPTIQKPTFTPTTGTVPPDADKNSQDAYHYTAIVLGADGKPYTGQEIKFKWQLKPVAQGNAQDTWLSEAGEMTVKPDGTLQVDLMSKQKSPVVKGAVVCLAVVDQNSVAIPVTEECADSVEFKPESVKIVSLTTDFDPTKTLKEGNGNASYTYTAKVVRADGTPLPDGHEVENVKWDFDLKPNTYNGKPEWEIKSDNIVKNGQLTATLTSNVGIGDINSGQVTDGLKVILSAPDGGKTSSKEAGPVAFEPVTQTDAWIKVFSDKKPDGIIFREQNRPYNAFKGLKGQLVDKLTGEPISKVGDNVTVTGGDIADIGQLDSPDKGVISFLIPSGKITLKMTVKKDNNAKYRYGYDFNIKKFFLSNSSNNLITTSSNEDCTNGDPTNAIKNVSDIDLFDGNTSLTKEFPHSFNWGILDIFDPSGKVSIIVPTNPGGSTKYLFDLHSDQKVSGNQSGYLLCVYNVS